MKLLLTLAALAALALAGCATTPSPDALPPPGTIGTPLPGPDPAPLPGPGSAPLPAPGAVPDSALPVEPRGAIAPSAPTPLAAPPTPLLTERRWLEDLFSGTPVAIAMPADDLLQIDVPLANSFDAGSAAPRPALAAVLDKVAESMRRQYSLRVSVAAAGDANAALARDRVQRVRDHLVSRQVGTGRITMQPAAAVGTGVQLRLSLPQPEVSRLHDSGLQLPQHGTKAVAPRSAFAPNANSGRVQRGEQGLAP